MTAQLSTSPLQLSWTTATGCGSIDVSAAHARAHTPSQCKRNSCCATRKEGTKRVRERERGQRERGAERCCHTWSSITRYDAGVGTHWVLSKPWQGVKHTPPGPNPPGARTSCPGPDWEGDGTSASTMRLRAAALFLALRACLANRLFLAIAWACALRACNALRASCLALCALDLYTGHKHIIGTSGVGRGIMTMMKG